MILLLLKLLSYTLPHPLCTAANYYKSFDLSIYSTKGRRKDAADGDMLVVPPETHILHTISWSRKSDLSLGCAVTQTEPFVLGI